MMHWDGDGMGAGWWVLMMVLMVIFWILVASAVFVFFRRSSGGTQQHGALEILDERFARGEIDHEEFEARRRTLRESAH